MNSKHMHEKDRFPSRLCINPTEAAKQLHISRSKMYELLHCGIIPHVRLGRRILIPTKELERWLYEQSITNSAAEEGDAHA